MHLNNGFLFSLLLHRNNLGGVVIYHHRSDGVSHANLVSLQKICENVFEFLQLFIRVQTVELVLRVHEHQLTLVAWSRTLSWVHWPLRIIVIVEYVSATTIWPFNPHIFLIFLDLLGVLPWISFDLECLLPSEFPHWQSYIKKIVLRLFSSYGLP